MATEYAIGTFIRESNRIEGIERAPTLAEIGVTKAFLSALVIDGSHVADLVKVYQPDARLRTAAGLNVRVGDHIAPPGGPDILPATESIIARAVKGDDPWRVHVDYETLHPFTDGNGRSGRALWLWQMYRHTGRIPAIGFLHTFYYQTLSRSRP